MDYNKLYNSLITNAKQRRQINGYTEIHHIVPSCLGGIDSAENLIKLTAREHFIAHYLLTKIHPSNLKLAYAFHMMSVVSPEKKQQRFGKSWIYHKAREALNDYQKINGPIFKHHNVCLKNFVWLKKDGINKKIDKTSEQYQKLLEHGWISGRNTFKRKPHSKETREKIASANKGKPSTTKGKILPTKGKTYEQIYGIENAKKHKQHRSDLFKGKIYSKYIWKLTSPEGIEFMIENANIIDFFKPYAPSVSKTVYVLLAQINKSQKPSHHGILKGWRALKILKEVA